MKKRDAAVFLDRDGTISREVDFLGHPDDLELIPRSAEAIRLLNEMGFRVVVVTNQSGVARGYFSEEMVRKIHDRLEEILEMKGAKVDAVYYCPHHPEAGRPPYRVECECRKPGTGMVDSAVRDLGVDPERSYMVGDKLSDIELARRFGGRGILVRTGYGVCELERLKADPVVEPDFVAEDLFDAVTWIRKEEGGGG